MYLPLRSELIKIKRTSSIYLIIITALIFPFFVLVDLNDEVEKLKFNGNIWNTVFLEEGFRPLNFIGLPIFVIFICTLIPQLEYRNHTWKQVFASPVPPFNTLVAKFLLVQLLIIIFLVVYNIIMATVPLWLQFLNPSFNAFTTSIKWEAWLKANAMTYINILGLSAVQFWLGIRFKNFLVPVGIGIFLLLLAPMLMFAFKIEFAYLHPHSLPIYAGMLIEKNDFSDFPGIKQLASLAHVVVFLLLVNFDYFNRKIKA
jgi:lantibiotic transport system permease protein